MFAAGFEISSMSEERSINATGQPDTPMEVINDLLGKSLTTKSPEDMKALVEQAYRISNGLDSYLDRMLSPVPQACQDLLTASSEHDWDTVYKEARFLVTHYHCLFDDPPFAWMLVWLAGADCWF